MQYKLLSKTILKSSRCGYFTTTTVPNKKEYFARKLIGFSIEDMYNVVVDVKNYKHFIPFCTNSTILSEENERIRANLEIGFPPIIENYTSNVTMLKPNFVKAVCKDGKLFNHLETTWKFGPGLKSNPRSCIVDFYILFEFKSAIYSQVANIFFDNLVSQMESAFFKEAQRRYGKESLATHQLSTTIQR